MDRGGFENFYDSIDHFSDVYKITDYNREEIQGSFYEQELQKNVTRHISYRKSIKGKMR